MEGQIFFSKHFNKHYRKAPIKIQLAFERIVALFEYDRFDERLRNHLLYGEWKDCRSIDVSGDWRAIYEDIVVDGKKAFQFVAIGTHSQLYG